MTAPRDPSLFGALPTLPDDVPKRPDRRVEHLLAAAGFVHVAGLDEAGRGCLAGPVVAAAVIMPSGVLLEGLDDSKKLEALHRARLLSEIQAKCLVGIGTCDAGEIDRWNILNASLEAMRRALAALPSRADFVLVDGNRRIPRLAVPQVALVRGDARSQSIAAASVVAKVTRDREMERLDIRHPGYGWTQNMGYPTADHFDALKRLGPSPVHRRSYRLRTPGAGQASLFAE